MYKESSRHYAIQLTVNHATKFFIKYQTTGDIEYGDMQLAHMKINELEDVKRIVETIKHDYPHLKPVGVKIVETVEKLI